ncbi:MAG: hypothetical protein LC794_10255 [Acidobacteria bacterium]|nr:hypothetical protein [Acidobacteriota bacterium]
MVFRPNAETQRMEVGLLRAANHIPRILTIRNSILFAVDIIPTELLDSQTPWELKATNPAESGIRTYLNGGSAFERQTHNDDRDFRWIMDLEGQEFYGRDLSAEMATKKLMPIITVPHGEFYTRLKSPPLSRFTETGEPTPFGAVAAAIGCDIRLDGGAVDLTSANGEPLFTFASYPNTIYEITNTPPDVFSSVGSGAAHHHHGPPPLVDGGTDPGSHFQHYYDLFRGEITPRFGLKPIPGSKAPDPALCGSVKLGERTIPLGEDSGPI